MTVSRILFSIVVLRVATMIYAQDDQSGFISIDCGSGSNHTENGITYVTDDGFVEGGSSYNIVTTYSNAGPSSVYGTLRSFPENERNCYTLRPKKGKKNRYLIRATFFYGNYDGKGQSPIFDLYIGADYWGTVETTNQTMVSDHEIIHLTSSDFIYVCLVNTGHGYPIITSLELRLLDITMYDYHLQSLLAFKRLNFGATEKVIRYKDDKYDRIWCQKTLDGCRALQTSNTVSLGPSNSYHVPSKVMSTAITPTISTGAIVYSWDADNTTDEFAFYIYFAEVEILKGNQNRELTIYVNNVSSGPYSVLTDITTIANTAFSSLTGSSKYTLIVNKTLNSTLPPILNALEIYLLKQLLQNHTDDQDAAAIWNTKSTYGLTKLNWQGDPCVPQAWVGLNCNYTSDGEAKIVSLNLSSRGLSGEIATALANLTMINSLDLSYNNLTGKVPKFLAQLDNLKILNLTGNKFTQPLPAELLAKKKKGLLSLSIEESNGEDKHRISRVHIAAIAIAVAALVFSTFAIVWTVKRQRKKAFINREEVFTPRKQQFAYSEVVGMTNNFENEIGRGGFGRVFHGSVGDSQVAVKMLSESSSQGYKEFQAEVKLLMEIHHTNITSLVGYCDDSNHKGIIYEFMSNGNLAKHLFDGSPSVLSWERRLQIACDAAEGLAYMHHGCMPPIVHRDVKSSNILLNEGFRAKLADFGLSRAFPTEDATYVSTQNVVGTVGYLDPEYHLTYRLTEKSDVYSFGVVLLELITSRRAISEGIYIINWVKLAVEEGNLEKIIDSRLDGHFDINIAWKVVEIATACVSSPSIKRPTMNEVVIDLKHCVQAIKTCRSKPVSLNMEIMSDPKPR